MLAIQAPYSLYNMYFIPNEQSTSFLTIIPIKLNFQTIGIKQNLKINFYSTVAFILYFFYYMILKIQMRVGKINKRAQSSIIYTGSKLFSLVAIYYFFRFGYKTLDETKKVWNRTRAAGIPFVSLPQNKIFFQLSNFTLIYGRTSRERLRSEHKNFETVF